MEASSSPGLGALVNQFAQKWKGMDKLNFKVATQDPKAAEFLDDGTVARIFQFASRNLQVIVSVASFFYSL